MQHGDDWLRGIGADLRKYAVEAFTATTELPERVVDTRRPVDAGDDFPARTVTSTETGAMNTESEFDDAGNAACSRRRSDCR